MFPWQQQDTVPSFALLLTSLADAINIDRAALRQTGLTRLHSVSRGEKALEIIRSQAGENPALVVDLVICTGPLDDMSLAAFMRAFAATGSLLPVMLISDNDSQLARAISQGVAAAVRRPYSLNEISCALESVRSPKRAQAPLVSAPQKNPAAEQVESKRAATVAKQAKATTGPVANEEKISNKLLWTRTGLNHLREGELDSAHELLSGALSYDPLDLEAAMGLSRLFQQHGEIENSHRWLHKAGCICLATRQTERAEVIFSRLPEKWQGDHELIEAQEWLLDGNFDAACEAFIQICTTRRNTPLHRLLGRACQFTSAPEECMREFCEALIRAGYESTAHSLAARMLKEEDERAWEPGGVLSAFPRIQEVWAVARFTAQALRASG